MNFSGRWLRATQGMVLALGAPLGWFAIETLRGATAHDPLLYAYMGLGTMLAFGLFGWYLGSIEQVLRRNINRDALTGLYNRRYFDERLDEEIAISHRNRRPLALVQLDIDYFKRINDTWGHDVGDEVLREAGEALAGSARPGDVVARVGGEEFAVILPRCDEKRAMDVAERMRDALSARRVVANNGDIVHMQASAGVAVSDPRFVTGPAAEAEALHRTADMAMYAAKQAGRNRSIAASAMESVPATAASGLLMTATLR